MSAATTTNRVRGQPVGETIVPPWKPRQFPEPKSACAYFNHNIASRTFSIQPLEFGAHALGLHQSMNCRGKETYERLFTYNANGCPDNLTMFQAWISRIQSKSDPMFFAVVENDANGEPRKLALPVEASASRRKVSTAAAKGKDDDDEETVAPLDAIGMFSLLRTDAGNGSTEIGWITFSPRLQRTKIATELLYVVMRYVFDELKYRRFEWKCDSLNYPSRDAATRFGFTFEGIFRQAVVVKGRNRDTAWYSILDKEYHGYIRSAFEHWLKPSNFDVNNIQKEKLGQVIDEMKKKFASALTLTKAKL